MEATKGSLERYRSKTVRSVLPTAGQPSWPPASGGFLGAWRYDGRQGGRGESGALSLFLSPFRQNRPSV